MTHRNQMAPFASRGGGTIFGDATQKIRESNVARGIFTLLVICVVLLVVYLIYRALQKKMKDLKVEKCRDSPKGCLLHAHVSNLNTRTVNSSPQGLALPPSTVESDHSINVWLYTSSTNWEKNVNNQWRHIMSGRSPMGDSQPSVWLHPNTNSLLIRWNTIPKFVPHSQCSNPNDAPCNQLSDIGKVQTILVDEKEQHQICSPVCVAPSSGTGNPSYKLEMVDYNETAYAKMDPSTPIQNIGCGDPSKLGNGCCNNITGVDKHQCGTGNRATDVAATIISQQCVPNIPLDRWYLLSIVTRSNSSDVYVDGKIVTTAVFPTAISDHPHGITMGGIKGKSGAPAGYWSQLRYYPQAITSFDILKVYSWGPYPFDLSKEEKDWKAKYERVTGSVHASASWGPTDTDDVGYQGF